MANLVHNLFSFIDEWMSRHYLVHYRIMLKRWGIFGVALAVSFANCRADQVETRKNNQQLTLPVATPPQQQPKTPGPQPQNQQEVHADVKIVNPPEKDFYDKAPVWINFVLLIVGILGVSAAVRTLKQIRRQAHEMMRQRHEMRRQTKHLEASVAIAQHSINLAIQGERPWVGLHGRIIVTKVIRQPRPMVEVSATIKNFGKSPAFNVIPAVDFVIGERTTDIRPEIEKTCARIENSLLPLKIGDVLFPGDTLSFPTEIHQPFNEERIDPIYFFPMCIIYTDMAGDTHHTKICQWADRDSFKEGAALSSSSRQSAD